MKGCNRLAAAVAAAVAVPISGAALAQSPACRDLIASATRSWNLTPPPPVTEGPGASGSTDGMILVPPLPDPMLRTPPAPSADPMPTVPAPPGSADAGSDIAAEAARQSRLQALVTAARQAELAGDEAGCLARMREAQELAR